jgi:hypothetical protein
LIDRELTGVMAYVNLRWPHRPVNNEAFAAWREDLAGVEVAAAHAAVVRLARSGREFPPTSGTVLNEIRRAEQALPPSFEDMMRWLSRNMWRLPYAADDRAMVQALEALTYSGAHEAICRFVEQEGVYAVRMTPDPSMHPLDPNQLADRRDKARAYRDRTLPNWQADPTPGLALRRVRDREALTADDGRAAVGTRGLRRLPAPEAPEEAIPEVAAEDVPAMIEQAKADMARRQLRRQLEGAERERQRQGEDKATRVAEAELAEHRQRRDDERSER